MAALLEVEGLTKAFGGLVAVNDMSLSVSPGEVLGLIGPNGSGKTTLLNLIAGTIRSDVGTIRIGGEDVTRLPNHLRVRKRINRTFQLVRMHFAHTRVLALENTIGGRVLGTDYMNGRYGRTSSCRRARCSFPGSSATPPTWLSIRN